MDIRRLDLNLLLLLDGLLTSGNLSSTARRLGVSQPSASASLAKLRMFFRDDLFVRTGRGLRPTPFAEGLAQPVRLVMEVINHEILLKPTFAPLESDRLFTLTMPDLGEIIFLPPIIRKLQVEAPNVGLKCVTIPYADVRDALEDGTIDLAIGHFPDLLEPVVQSQALYEDRFVCVARRDHPRAHDGLSKDDFLQLDQLAVEREGSQIGPQAGSGDTDQRLRTRLEIPHFMSVPRLVAASDMISAVPLSLASRFADVYGLRIFEPPMPLPKVLLKQFWHRRMGNDPALGWLRSLIASQLLGLDPRGTATF